MQKPVFQGDRGVFFTATETIPKLKKFQGSYDFFDEKLIKSGELSIIDLWSISDRLGLHPERYTLEEANVLFEVIRDITKELDAKRLIIDSITSLCFRLQTKENIRDFCYIYFAVYTSNRNIIFNISKTTSSRCH